MAVLGLFAGGAWVLLIHRRARLRPPHCVHLGARRGIAPAMGLNGLDMMGARCC